MAATVLPMKILLCDDHALFREGLAHVLAGVDDDLSVLEAGDLEEALRLIGEHDDLDLVLLDLGLPGARGLGALRELRERCPTVSVAVVSASDDASLVRGALAAGASGFVPKSSTGPVLRSALRLILSGGVYVPEQALAALPSRRSGAAAHGDPLAELTPRQREVADLVARGLTNKEICSALGIAEGTVKAHVAALLETLGVSNRTEAAAVLRERT
jgi:DNA-binding NarL/FixJ family response regulator